MHSKFFVSVAVSLCVAGGIAATGCFESAARPAAAEELASPNQGPLFHGMSDASAAAVIGNNRIVVGDDESNSLRIYDLGGGSPVAQVRLDEFLDIEPKHPEADIEGCARAGNRIYWITSHGNNSDGKERPNRHRFFATDIEPDGSIKPVGALCRDLLDMISGLPGMPAVEAAPQKKKKGGNARLAPKVNGLNIEGLAASPDGSILYIGLRNPKLPRGGKALTVVVPLLNPAAIVEENAGPKIGEPMLWDLAGRGIRAMEFSPAHQCFFIVGGPRDDQAGGALYRWSGIRTEQPELVRELDEIPDFHPEALICFENSSKLLILSDDGSRHIAVSGAWECLDEKLEADGTCLNKFLKDENKRSYRSLWIEP